MPIDDFEKLIEEAHRTEPVPEFDRTWRRAEIMASERIARKSPIRLVLVPVAGMAALVLLATAFFLLAPEAGHDQSKPIALAVVDDSASKSISLLDGLEDPAPWTSTLEGLQAEWGFDDSDTDTDTDTENEEIEEADRATRTLSSNTPGEGVYESATDFLLNLETPVWNETEERSVL